MSPISQSSFHDYISPYQRQQPHPAKKNVIKMTSKIRSIWAKIRTKVIEPASEIIRKIKKNFKEKKQNSIQNIASSTFFYPTFTCKSFPSDQILLDNLEWKFSKIIKSKEQKNSPITTLFEKSSEIKENSNSEKELLILKELAKIKFSDNQEVREKLYLFCATMDLDKNTFGKIFFLFDRYPQGIAQAIRQENIEHFLKLISHNFEEALEKTSLPLYDLFVNHQKTELQPTDIAINNHLPLEISKMLWTSTGVLNVSIIPNIVSYYIQKKKDCLNYEISLSHNLQILENNPTLQAKLNSIAKPNSKSSPAHLIICATLGLPKTAEISDLMTKQVALAALLTHLRQDEEGSCFALYLAIELLISKQEKCVDDFTHLISESKLTRIIDSSPTDLPFLLKGEDKSLDKAFKVDRNGQLRNEQGLQGFLWEAPGIEAACHFLEISNVEEFIKALIKKESSSISSIILTPRKLFKMISKELSAKTSCSFETLFSQAKLAFSAQTRNLLLQSWACAIAGMAEAKPNSFLKDAIVGSSLHAISISFKEVNWPSSVFKKIFFEKLEKTLYERIHLFYDPTVKNPSKIHRMRDSRGAFVLYEKDDHEDPQLWKRVDHAKMFQQFLLKITLEIYEKMAEEEKTLLENLPNKFENLIKNYVFLYALISKYQQLFPEGENLSQGYEKLACTPWLNKLGHDANYILQIYWELEKTPKLEQLKPVNAEDLLLKLISLGRQDSRMVDYFESNPYKMLPLRIPGMHAFSLMPHHLLRDAWKSHLSIQDWIEQKVSIPGKKISQSIIDEITRRKIIEHVANSWVKKEKIKYFNHRTKHFPENLSIQKFRDSVLQALKGIENGTENSNLEIVCHLDTFICEAIPQHQELVRYLIPFADTNWHFGIHDVHFCFAINPGTAQLEIMEVSDDGSHLRAIDQKISHQNWEYSLQLIT